MIVSPSRIRSISRKEILHILRDWQTLTIVIAMPVVMMFLYGYALTLDLREVAVLVEDPERSPASLELIRAIDASPQFKVQAILGPQKDPVLVFRQYSAKALFRLPAGLDRNLRDGGSAAIIQTLIDGSEPNTGTLVQNMAEPLVRGAVLSYLQIEPPKTVRVESRILYNPQQKSALYFVPGLMAIILLMISALLTSLTLTREKERGTMALLLISPLKPAEVILGKIFPYFILAGLDGVLIMMVGRMFFGVHTQGSLIFLTIASVLYIGVGLAIGLAISTVAKNQQQALFIVMPATMLPTIILSGFIFPVESMPIFLQGVAHLIPATYFLQIIRGIILKGVGIAELWKPTLVLTVFMLFLLRVSVMKFRTRL